MPRRVLLAAALLGALGGAARAASFTRAELPGPLPAIRIAGVLAPGDAAAFHAPAWTLPQAVIVTTGPGGSVGAAIAIGSEIRNRGWPTLVPANTACASACAMIWLAGTRRFLAEGARIGFHAMSYRENGIAVETHEPDFDLRRWLTQLGYSDDTTATIVATPSRTVRWLDRLELQANGIATEPYP